MQLVTARVRYYRSVTDSGEFAVEPDVTCLVGPNESGKTNILQALYRLNPAESCARFDEVVDFPARLTRQRRQFPGGRMIPVITADFCYDDEQMAEIEASIGPGTDPEFTVTGGYRSVRMLGHSCDEAAIVRNLCSGIDLPASAVSAVMAKTTVTGLLRALEALPELAAAQALAERIRGWRDQSLNAYLIDTYAWPLLPKFVYFGESDVMPGKVSIPDLIRKRDINALTRGERALLSLLSMAEVRPEDLRDADHHERLIRQLEIAGNVISDEVSGWTRSKDLGISVKVLDPETGAAPPLDEGPLLHVRVDDRRHGISVPLSRRPAGFAWLFSFLAYLSELEVAQASRLIVLLDEPGLSLDTRAQQDLRRAIDDHLAGSHQVIYTTTSPFMIPVGQTHRVRSVNDHKSTGTKISAQILKADNYTANIVLAAVGTNIADALFTGEHTLLLESSSDLIYLEVLSNLAKRQQLPGLDPRWVKTPVGGTDMLSAFMTLARARKWHVAALMNSSTRDTGPFKRLQSNGFAPRKGLIKISEFTGTADADLEDLFDRSFYLDLVDRAYAADLTAPIIAADLTAGDPRVVTAVADYFAKHNVAGGSFDRYKPAAVLLARQATLIDHIGADTAARAGQLLARVNSLILEPRSSEHHADEIELRCGVSCVDDRWGGCSMPLTLQHCRNSRCRQLPGATRALPRPDHAP